MNQCQETTSALNMIMLHIIVVSINVIATCFVILISDEAFRFKCTGNKSSAKLHMKYAFAKHKNLQPRTYLRLIC